MPVLQQLRHSAGHFYRRLGTRRDLSGLAAANPHISTAILDAASGRTSEAERTWIERIEELRRRMSASSNELEICDYGAGSGSSALTGEEMESGRMIRRTVGEVCTLTSRTERTALLLLRLIRELKPRTCVELGTSLGISACYQAAALKLNGTGSLVTLEGADSVASVAAQNFEGLGLDNVEVVRGRFQDTLPEVLPAHPAVDYAFIDGHHDEAATIKYFNAFLPSLAEKAVIVFDDIQWSEGMKRAWNAIQQHSRVNVSVDLGSMGLVFIAGGIAAGPMSPRRFSTAF